MLGKIEESTNSPLFTNNSELEAQNVFSRSSITQLYSSNMSHMAIKLSGGSILQPVDRVKCLGLILDRKLSWEPYI